LWLDHGNIVGQGESSEVVAAYQGSVAAAQ
jgi:ABC-type polysaccharide/polyol phosphate transport system ATPase subunit